MVGQHVARQALGDQEDEILAGNRELAARNRDEVRTVVEEESVVLAPGALFGYDDYFRIGFGLPAEELDEGLPRVAACIKRHR